MQYKTVDKIKSPFSNSYINFCRAWFRTNSSSPPTYEKYLLYDIGKYEPEKLDPLEVFPKCGKIIKEKLREYLDLVDELEPTFDKKMVELYKIKNIDNDALIDLYKILDIDIPKEIYQQHIKRLEHLLRRIEWKKKPSDSSESDRITDEDIAHAKQVPILEVMGLKLIRGFVHCPFHYEKTASCKIDSSNRYHCFGACGTGGDTIDYLMKKENLSFLEAVKKLCHK